jgi:GT2 family glycosyltransferase
MNKFTVIIPTMWRDSSIFELLNRLYTCEYVSEVILINNDVNNTPDFTKHKKLLYIEPYENIFVNPVWNMGVAIASTEYVSILNDDILFDVDLYFHFMNTANQYLNAGYVGSHSKNYEITELDDTTIEPYDNKTNTGGWGCLFSFNKKNWIPIPNQLKIWYGDNWIHATNPNIFQLNGFPIKTKMSVSSELQEVRGTRDNDTTEWLKIVNRVK